MIRWLVPNRQPPNPRHYRFALPPVDLSCLSFRLIISQILALIYRRTLALHICTSSFRRVASVCYVDFPGTVPSIFWFAVRAHKDRHGLGRGAPTAGESLHAWRGAFVFCNNHHSHLLASHHPSTHLNSAVCLTTAAEKRPRRTNKSQTWLKGSHVCLLERTVAMVAGVGIVLHSAIRRRKTAESARVCRIKVLHCESIFARLRGVPLPSS